MFNLNKFWHQTNIRALALGLATASLGFGLSAPVKAFEIQPAESQSVIATNYHHQEYRVATRCYKKKVYVKGGYYVIKSYYDKHGHYHVIKGHRPGHYVWKKVCQPH